MTDSNQRRATRSRMIKGAEIMAGSGILQCAVLDLSAVGVRAYLPHPSDVPEVVNLRLPDGKVRPARRVWQDGAEVGFELLPADTH